MHYWILLLLIPWIAFAQTPAPEPEPTPMELPDVPPGEVFMAKDLPIASAVDRLVMAVTHTGSRAEAWKSLVKPTDKIGLKVSAAGGETFSTHREIVDAVVAGLNDAGIASTSIIVWDRDAADLKAAGFVEKRGGYRVRWPYPGKGYSPKNVYVSMVLGKLIWGDLDFTKRRTIFEINPLDKVDDNLSSNSHFARILTDDVTKVINLPVLSSHASCGVAGALYNMTIPNVDNWRRFTTTFGESDPAIAEIYSDPMVMDKVVLHIMDGLIAQFAGGPESQPNYAVTHGTIYASKDPVALDSIALKRIDEWRARAKLKPVTEDARYLRSAREYGLGNPGNNTAKSLP